MSSWWLRFWFILTFLILFSVPELILGMLGVVFPLVGALIFYITIVYSWRTGVVAAIGGAVLLDLASGRTFPWLLVAFPLLVLSAWSFRRGRELRELQDMLLPLLCSFAAMELVFFILECWSSERTVLGILSISGMFIWNCLAGTLLGSILFWGLDALALRLGLPCGISRELASKGKIRFSTLKNSRGAK